jgi:hypothetical protein
MHQFKISIQNCHMSRAFDLLADLRPLTMLPLLEIASAIHPGACVDVFQEAM